MTKLRSITSVALLGFGIAAFASTGAFARIVCNDEGDCWHTTTVYDYPHESHVVVHEDNWKWPEKEHFSWREHEGRGYWRNHAWVDF